MYGVGVEVGRVNFGWVLGEPGNMACVTESASLHPRVLLLYPSPMSAIDGLSASLGEGTASQMEWLPLAASSYMDWGADGTH